MAAGLDPRTRRSLIRLLAELPQTLPIAIHDMRRADELFARTIVMDGGWVIADSPTAELLPDEALLEAHGLENPCS